MSIEKIRVESQQELEEMVTKEIGQIEKELNVICNHVPINDKTILDVLCHDTNGQLVILQISVSEDDIMLLQGIQSLDYVDKFKSFLKATYNKHKIDDKEKPRLILIAPGFSDALRRAVEGMKGLHIDLYEWEYLKLGDHKGLRLQPIFTFRPTEKLDKPVEKKEPKHEPKLIKKKETTPEPQFEKKEEETKQEPLKEEIEPPPPFPWAEPKEDKPVFKPQEKEEPQKRKLKLF